MRGTLKSQINRYVRYWRPVLGLEGWDLQVKFDNKAPEQGYCISDRQYLKATVGFNLERIRKELKPGLPREELVLHELVHVLNPLSSEQSISQTTWSLLRARAITTLP